MTADDTPIRHLTRADIRELATHDAATIAAAVARGENGGQLILDLQDKLIALAETMGPDFGQQFLDMYGEEIDAASAPYQAARTAAAVQSTNISIWIGSLITAVSIVILYLFLTRGA